MNLLAYHLCLITYYSSPTRFGHSCDHHQGGLEYNKYTKNCTEMYDNTNWFCI